jgi:transposase InsO family protein
LEDERLVPSMGRVGSAYDNTLAESFVATLKTELLYRASWPAGDKDDDLRVHRGLLQHPKETFFSRLPKPCGV